MAKKTSIDVYIEEKKTSEGTKSILKIPYTASRTNKSLRIYDGNGNQVFYASVRIGTLIQTDNGYECDMTNKDFIGYEYELTEVSTKELVLQGKILNKKSEVLTENGK